VPVVGVPGQPGTPLAQIAFQRVQRHLPDRYHPYLSPFALDAHVPRPEVEISEPQIQHLLAS
jgi:hypothetical protein